MKILKKILQTLLSILIIVVVAYLIIKYGGTVWDFIYNSSNHRG